MFGGKPDPHKQRSRAFYVAQDSGFFDGASTPACRSLNEVLVEGFQAFEVVTMREMQRVGKIHPFHVPT